MNAMNDVITLKTIQTDYDSDGRQMESLLESADVFATVKNVKRTEFYAADREGIKLALTATINADDFTAAAVVVDGKKIKPSRVEYDSAEYKIYRVYQTNDVTVELTLQEVE